MQNKRIKRQNSQYIIIIIVSYLRLYLIYKLEKLKGIHEFQSFIDFFNNAYTTFRWEVFIMIIPFLRKNKSRKLEVIRFQINILTIFVYLFFGLSIYLSL